jgi:hypothetical protein
MAEFQMIDCEMCGTPSIDLPYKCNICGKAICTDCFARGRLPDCPMCGFNTCSECIGMSGMCKECEELKDAKS